MDTERINILTTLLCMVLALILGTGGVFGLSEGVVKAAIQRPDAPVRRVRRENEENSLAVFIDGGVGGADASVLCKRMR